MRTLLSVLCSVLLLVASVTGQEPKKGEDAPRKTDEIRGEAKLSVHAHKMEQGQTYRITVRGEGFLPQVRIDGQPRSLIAPPPAPGGKPGELGTVAQLMFTAPASKTYSIVVDVVAGTEVGRGPHSYALTVERATFRPHQVLKDEQHEAAQHSRKMEQGKMYGITVTGTGFAPEVQVLDGSKMMATGFNGRWYGFGPDAECVINLTFTPARTADYRIVVAVGPQSVPKNATPTFTTKVVELKIELNVAGRLNKEDPAHNQRGGPHKVHVVKLEANKNYQIDMVSQAFDAYLFLEDAAGKVLAEDDDSGGTLNARIQFRPTKSGEYRVIATIFDRGQAVRPLGPYALTVVENPHEQTSFPAPLPPSRNLLDDLLK